MNQLIELVIKHITNLDDKRVIIKYCRCISNISHMYHMYFKYLNLSFKNTFILTKN